jgi:ribonuclease HII
MRRPFNPRRRSSYPAVIGTDEVGRGCVASCVLVASVWFDPSVFPRDLLAALDDSKRLSAKARRDLAVRIHAHARVAFAASSPQKIDSINIRQATLDAMRRSIIRLGINAPIFIDGNDVPLGLPGPATAIVKGDQKVPQIAAASIVAKVMRDSLLAKLSLRYPVYCWDRNAGYGTKAHLDALRAHGPTAHHRCSFLGGILPSLNANAISVGDQFQLFSGLGGEDHVTLDLG